MKPSIFVFALTAAMSVCFLLSLFSGQAVLAAGALLLTALGFGLTITLEEAGK
jgi:hypothetical protein